jgi:hypothetical protein
MDPHSPAKGQMRPITQFYQGMPSADSAESAAKGGSFNFSLDHEDQLLGLVSMHREGAFQRGFRRSGPEIGEGNKVNG